MSLNTEFEQIKTDLNQLGSELSPSELHGTLCGLLCVNGDINIHDWLLLTLFNQDNAMTAEVGARKLLLTAIAESFTDFFVSTVTALADNSLNFHPLLPDDDAKQTLRLQAIAQWAQGFLMGLSLAKVKQFDQYSAEVTEFVEAMTTMATVEEYELAGDDSDEESIIEFVEFIRIGVLLVNEEINPLRVPLDLDEEFK
jgi:uncharacterized protein YgfB (UPF0149 family)